MDRRAASHLDNSSAQGVGVEECGGDGGATVTPQQRRGHGKGERAGWRLTAAGRAELAEPHDCALRGLGGLPVVAPRDRRGLVQLRSPQEVLRVLCGGVEGCEGGGGFFPDGLPGGPPRQS